MVKNDSSLIFTAKLQTETGFYGSASHTSFHPTNFSPDIEKRDRPLMRGILVALLITDKHIFSYASF